MEDRFDWVQIIEPKSKDAMYANLVTGECVWQAPLGAKIKKSNENQWWELFDNNTKRNYYYNAKTQRTIWQRPSNADIIPLAKLQMINENTECKDDQKLISPPVSTINHTVEQINNKWKQTYFKGFDKTRRDTKLKLLTTNCHSTIERSICQTSAMISPSKTSNKDEKTTYDNLNNSIVCPLNNQYDNFPIVSTSPQISLEQSLHSKRSQSINLKFPFTLQMTSNEINHQCTNISKYTFSTNHKPSSTNISRHISTPTLELLSTNLPSSIEQQQTIRKKQPRTNPNYVNIQIKTTDGTLRSTYIRLNEMKKCSTLTFTPSEVNKSNEHNSSNETLHHEQVNNDKTKKPDLMMKQFITCTDEFLFHSTTDPLNLNFQQTKSINNGNHKSSKSSTPLLPIYYDSYSNSSSITSHSMNRSHETGSIDSSSSITHFHSLTSNKKSRQISIHKQSISSSIKFPPIINEIECDIHLNDMLNLNIHKRGLFSKRTNQDQLLSWSRESLNKPLLRSIDKILKKEAPELFRLIQIYMGDKKSKQNASLNTCLDLTIKGWSLPTIRDELYLQLIKQTTYNQNAESLQRGWELMAICLSFFPPSSKFQLLLERYIALQTNGDVDTSEVPISVYAKVCQKRLERILQTGPKKGLKKPTYEEIELSKHTIHFPSMFGATLEEVMVMQRTRYPDKRLPWIQTILSEEVLRLNGAQIEGIFRVPGDLDSVNALKVKCDQWQFPSIDDAHLPASLLKLWYRELSEPLIPSIFYDQCITNCDKVEPCINLIHSLPEINRIVLTYLIRFLQIFAKPENVIVTKMDVNNLSMVFAPNILRCNSDDAKIIFENARKEMLFVKILIVNLDTDSVEGVI